MISIIIRTFNEEKWISMCLRAIASQEIDIPIEIILVDSESSDKTVSRAKQFSKDYGLDLKTFFYKVSKKGYLPGEALNYGWKNSKGEFIVFLSAHCVPANNSWLSELVSPLLAKKTFVSYGRQIPAPFSSLIDKRDLINQFSIESRIQKKDFFFHNANSCISRNLLKKFEFDEDITNVEDRVWSKKIIDNGYNIYYQANSIVFHYHGLNQDNSINRLKGVVNVLEQKVLDKISYENNFNADIAVIINTAENDLNNKYTLNVLNSAIKSIDESKLIKDIYWFVPNIQHINKLGLITPKSCLLIEKDKQDNKKNIFDLTYKQINYLENKKNFYDFYVFLETCYLDRPSMIIDEIIKSTIINGFDKCIAAVVEKRPLFLSAKDGITNSQFNKSNYFIGLPGLCRIATAHQARSSIFGYDNCGIHVVNDPSFALKNVNQINF